MTYEQAETVAKELSKHNPFVRLTAEEQQQAEQAHRVLQKNKTEEAFEEGVF